jgi:putative hemolysin
MDSLPSNIWLRIAFSGGALIACAIFSFMETSITALRLFNLKELAKKTGRYTKLFSTLELEPQRVLIAILITNCIANVMAADLITDLVEHSFAQFGVPAPWNFILGVAVATTGILIFGEIIPKSLAQGKSDRLFLSTLWLTNITFYIMSPLVILLSRVSKMFVNMIGSGPIDSTQAVASEKEIQFLIQHIRTKGQMDSDKSEMLHSIFDLADTTIREIMVPEIDVTTLNVNTSLTDTLEVFSQHHFSRLPVYENKPDNIIGMIHQKDLFLLLAKKEEKPLKELVRPILFVPESMKVNQLLRQFKQQRHHIAMVLNEYGGIIGLVTLEDALEEIVGDINDEHESVAEHIVSLEQGGWLVYAGVDLEVLEQTLDITFKTDDAITLGGFLTEQLQHLPRKGEKLSYKNYTFQIQKATQKRIIQVLIFKEENK